MCDPVTAAVIVGVTSVASTVGSVVAQTKAAKAQTSAIRQQAAVVQEENRQEATGQLFDQMRASRREQARIRTAAGEAGLSTDSGNVEHLLMDSAMQADLQGQRSIANFESRRSATTAQEESQLSQIQKPTTLGAGLQIANSVTQAWTGVRTAKIQTGTTKTKAATKG